jgi:hypothetical protein
MQCLTTYIFLFVHNTLWSIIPDARIHKFCQFCSDKCEIVYVSMFAVIFDRNGAKVYVKKIYEISLREKSAKRGFMKYSSPSSTNL